MVMVLLVVVAVLLVLLTLLVEIIVKAIVMYKTVHVRVPASESNMGKADPGSPHLSYSSHSQRVLLEHSSAQLRLSSLAYHYREVQEYHLQ